MITTIWLKSMILLKNCKLMLINIMGWGGFVWGVVGSRTCATIEESSS